MCDNNGDLPLHVSAANQAGLEVVKMLLDAYPDGAGTPNSNEGGWLPLHVAVGNRAELPIVQLLLEANRGALTRPDVNRDLPLHIAAGRNAG